MRFASPRRGKESSLLAIFLLFLVGCAGTEPTEVTQSQSPGETAAPSERVVAETIPSTAASEPQPSTPVPATASETANDGLFSKTQKFDRFLMERLPVWERRELLDACRTRPEENIFCFSMLNRELLERKTRLRRRASFVPTRRSRAVYPRFHRGRVKNWDALRAATVGGLLKGLGGSRPSELLFLRDLAQAEKECPNNVAIGIAATLEDRLPDQISLADIAELYSRGGDCLRASPADRENILTRAGLFFFAAKDYPSAQKAFAKASQVDTVFSGRALYWLYRTHAELKESRKSREALEQLQTRYPFSFHTLVCLTGTGRDPGEILKRRSPSPAQRSQHAPGTNSLIEQVEILHRYGFLASATKVLDWAIAESPDLEPEVMLYLAELKKEQGDYHSKISLLSDLLYKHPALVSRETLELYFPKVFFPIFERHSSVMDPYLLLAVARRESAFRPNAISPANARGLLQVMPQTGRRLGVARRQLLDPDTNVEVGARYLMELLRKVNGQVHMALAAYNAGPNRLTSWLERYAVVDPILFIDLIPFRETREYVASVLRNYYWYRRIHKSDDKMTSKRLLELANKANEILINSKH